MLRTKYVQIKTSLKTLITGVQLAYWLRPCFMRFTLEWVAPIQVQPVAGFNNNIKINIHLPLCSSGSVHRDSSWQLPNFLSSLKVPLSKVLNPSLLRCLCIYNMIQSGKKWMSSKGINTASLPILTFCSSSLLDLFPPSSFFYNFYECCVSPCETMKTQGSKRQFILPRNYTMSTKSLYNWIYISRRQLMSCLNHICSMYSVVRVLTTLRFCISGIRQDINRV